MFKFILDVTYKVGKNVYPYVRLIRVGRVKIWAKVDETVASFFFPLYLGPGKGRKGCSWQPNQVSSWGRGMAPMPP